MSGAMGASNKTQGSDQILHRGDSGHDYRLEDPTHTYMFRVHTVQIVPRVGIEARLVRTGDTAFDRPMYARTPHALISDIAGSTRTHLLPPLDDVGDLLLASLEGIEHTQEQPHRAVGGSRQVVFFSPCFEALVELHREKPGDLPDTQGVGTHGVVSGRSNPMNSASFGPAAPCSIRSATSRINVTIMARWHAE